MNNQHVFSTMNEATK